MEILKKLIQTNSVSGNEEKIQKYILDLLSSFGLNPSFVEGNVVVTVDGNDKTKCLLFNAHVDTVSTGGKVTWEHDPFMPKLIDDKIYGLGSSDNKASVAVLLDLAKTYSHTKPACDLIFTFTVGEEIDGHGTKSVAGFLKKKYLGKYTQIGAVVTEPTSSSYFCTGHMGNIFLKVTTSGKSGHGSSPIKAKDHSVMKMYEAIKSLQSLSAEWQKKYKDPLLGAPTIGIATSIKAGDPVSPNKFPESCECTFDIRTVPKMHKLAITEIEKVLPDGSLHEYVYEPVGFAYTKSSEHLVELFKIQKLPLKKFTGSSDMPFFTELGIATVIFGPGEPGMMHKPDEYCKKSSIDKSIKILKRIVSKF